MSGLTAEAVARLLAERRKLPRKLHGLSVKSSNHYLASIKGFCGWLVATDRAARNPLASLTKLNASTDRRHVRRALEAEEIRFLLTATRNSTETSEGMTPEARYWLYRLATETGLRSAELRSLTRSSFDLDGPEPSVTIEARDAKNRRAATIPLRSSTAAELRDFIGSKLPTARAFNMPRPEKIVMMLRGDLGAAGITYADDVGRVADFHSLRKSFATMLLRSGVDVRTAKDLMRHSTIAMTADVYAVSVRGSLGEAVASLPDLSIEAVTRAAKNGTTGDENRPARLPASLPKSCAKPREAARSMTTAARPATESKTRVKPLRNSDLCRAASHDIARSAKGVSSPPRGFEPLDGLSEPADSSIVTDGESGDCREICRDALSFWGVSAPWPDGQASANPWGVEL